MSNIKKKGLGKGLSALFGEANVNPSKTVEIIQVKKTQALL